MRKIPIEFSNPMKDTISSKTTFQLSFPQMVSIAIIIVTGALAYADIKYEFKETRKETIALVETFKLYTLRQQTKDMGFLFVRKFATNEAQAESMRKEIEYILDRR
jgi:hypothetical protein